MNMKIKCKFSEKTTIGQYNISKKEISTVIGPYINLLKFAENVYSNYEEKQLT